MLSKAVSGLKDGFWDFRIRTWVVLLVRVLLALFIWHGMFLRLLRAGSGARVFRHCC